MFANLKNRFQSFMRDVDYMAGYEMMIRYEEGALELPVAVIKLQIIIHFLWMRVVQVYCERVAGHDYEDLSAAGPNWGDVYLECQRCGYTHHKRLY